MYHIVYIRWPQPYFMWTMLIWNLESQCNWHYMWGSIQCSSEYLCFWVFMPILNSYGSYHYKTIWGSPCQLASMWETWVQTAPSPPPTRLCLSKTHSAAQPHAPEHSPCGQPSPETQADCVGTGVNHTNWKNSYRHNLHQLEEQTI